MMMMIIIIIIIIMGKLPSNLSLKTVPDFTKRADFKIYLSIICEDRIW